MTKAYYETHKLIELLSELKCTEKLINEQPIGPKKEHFILTVTEEVEPKIVIESTTYGV